MEKQKIQNNSNSQKQSKQESAEQMAQWLKRGSSGHEGFLFLIGLEFGSQRPFWTLHSCYASRFRECVLS